MFDWEVVVDIKSWFAFKPIHESMTFNLRANTAEEAQFDAELAATTLFPRAESVSSAVFPRETGWLWDKADE